MPGIEQLTNMIKQMLMPLQNRIVMSISRAVIESVKDTEGMQIVKVNLLAGESREGIERMQNYGFSGVPTDNAEAVAVAIGSNRDHLIIIACDDRTKRIKGLEKGESVQYNSNGDKWHLKKDGTLEGTLSKNLEVTLKKLKLTNGTDEIVDLLIQLSTAIAAEPFIVNSGTFSDIATKFTGFKVL